MTSWECYENKWFYMKYIGKMAETESLLSTCCGIDRPLNLSQYPGSNIYFSIPEENKYIINNLGLMKKKYFGWSGVYFIFMLYNCYVPTYHRFLRQILLLKHHYLKWIIKCTEIVYIYIMVSYIQSEEWKYWF
jgi:hypothetical protein